MSALASLPLSLCADGRSYLYFYEVLLPHLLGKPIREAMDKPPPAWASDEMICFSKESFVQRGTMVACLRCLLARYDFDSVLSAKLQNDLRLQTLADVQADITALLEDDSQVSLEAVITAVPSHTRLLPAVASQPLLSLPPPLLPQASSPRIPCQVVDSDILTIELITRRAVAQTLETFPVRSKRAGGADSSLSKEVHTDLNARVKKAREDAAKLRILDGKAASVQSLAGLSLSDRFHSFPGFELSVDRLPFHEERRAASSASSLLLNLHRGILAQPPGTVQTITHLMKAVDTCVSVCDELRYGNHGVDAKVSTRMVAALVEHACQQVLPIPQPWLEKSTLPCTDLYNPRHGKPTAAETAALGAGGGGGRSAASRNTFTTTEQQQLLAQVESLLTHYLAAAFSEPLSSSGQWSPSGEAPLRNHQGEQLATTAALYAIFDAILRRPTSNTPLTLTQLMNGTHAESHGDLFNGNLCMDTTSFCGTPLAFMLQHQPIRRPRALRVRRQVLRYFSDSDFCRYNVREKQPNVLMGKFSALKESKAVGKGSNSGRIATISVDGKGQAKEDAIENLAQMIVRRLGLEKRDIQPPSYLPLEKQKPVPVDRVAGPHKNYLQLTQIWSTLGAPELDSLKHVLVLFKTAVDWMPSVCAITKSAGSRSQPFGASGVLLPRDITPGFFCDKSESSGESLVTVSLWLGQRSFGQNNPEGTPLRQVETAGLEEFRLDLGMQPWLAHSLHSKLIREAEQREVDKKPDQALPNMLSTSVDEDQILLNADLPLSVTKGGTLSQEESETLLTYLSAPFVALPLVLDFFADARVGYLVDEELTSLLERLMWQPEVFSDQAAAERSRAADIEVPLRRQTVSGDVRSDRDDFLGTPDGVLAWELRMRPSVLLDALCRLCESGLKRCVSDAKSSFVSLLLFFVRLATTVEAAMLCVLETLHMEEEAGSTFEDVLHEAGPYLRALHTEFLDGAVALIEHWLVQTHADQTQLKALPLVVLHAHLLLVHGNLHRGWPVEVVDGLREHGVAVRGGDGKPRPAIAMAPSMALVVQLTSGAEGEEVPDESAWLKSLLTGPVLLPSVYATIQESRGSVIQSARVMKPPAKLYSWLEQVVKVAQRHVSGGEPFPPEEGGRAERPNGRWMPIGSHPLQCERTLTSPGWFDKLPDGKPAGYPPSTNLYGNDVARASVTAATNCLLPLPLPVPPLPPPPLRHCLLSAPHLVTDRLPGSHCMCAVDVYFPGSPCIVVTFDEETELEDDSDFLTFHKDASKRHACSRRTSRLTSCLTRSFRRTSRLAPTTDSRFIVFDGHSHIHP